MKSADYCCSKPTHRQTDRQTEWETKRSDGTFHSMTTIAHLVLRWVMQLNGGYAKWQMSPAAATAAVRTSPAVYGTDRRDLVVRSAIDRIFSCREMRNPRLVRVCVTVCVVTCIMCALAWRHVVAGGWPRAPSAIIRLILAFSTTAGTRLTVVVLPLRRRLPAAAAAAAAAARSRCLSAEWKTGCNAAMPLCSAGTKTQPIRSVTCVRVTELNWIESDFCYYYYYYYYYHFLNPRE